MPTEARAAVLRTTLSHVARRHTSVAAPHSGSLCDVHLHAQRPVAAAGNASRGGGLITRRQIPKNERSKPGPHPSHPHRPMLRWSLDRSTIGCATNGRSGTRRRPRIHAIRLNTGRVGGRKTRALWIRPTAGCVSSVDSGATPTASPDRSENCSHLPRPRASPVTRWPRERVGHAPLSDDLVRSAALDAHFPHVHRRWDLDPGLAATHHGTDAARSLRGSSTKTPP